MKKTILVPILLFAGYILTAQNNVSFDQLSFTEPVNWSFTDYGSYHTYSIADNTVNIFCIISVYSSDASSGDPGQDFRTAWKGIVAGHFTVSKDPKPKQNVSAGGLSYLQDEATVSNDKGNFFAKLLVFDLKGKTQSVLLLSGNKNSLDQYQPGIDKFLASIRSNNAQNPGVANTATVNSASVVSTSSGLIHFNHFLFTVPAGWKMAQDGNIMTLSLPVRNADEMLSFILLPPVTDTSFQEAGSAAITQLATALGGKAIESPAVTHPYYTRMEEGKFAKGWQYSAGTGRIQVSFKNDNDPYSTNAINFSVSVFLAKIHGRIERVAYLSKDYKCGIFTTSTASNEPYEPLLDDFFFNMKFDDWTDANISQGKITHSGISYVWSGVSYLATWAAYSATFFILFDNGQAYYSANLPGSGLLGLNSLAAAAERPDLWGTYTYQNGSGVIKISSWLNVPFTIKDGKMVAQVSGAGRPFEKLPSIDGAVLNGSWSHGNSVISFTRDGKFTDDGMILFLKHLPVDCNEIEPKNGKGNYEIKNYTIVFHYDNGLTTQVPISGLGMENGNSSPNQLFIGCENNVLQKIR